MYTVPDIMLRVAALIQCGSSSLVYALGASRRLAKQQKSRVRPL